MVGRTITHYRIVEKLGAGGMGEVFKAEDLSLGRMVALKFLSPSMAGDRQAVERLRREARAASILNHPGICTIHAIEESDGQQFIAMELLEGQPLANLIAAGPVPLPALLPLAIQIADALEAAHSHGIVHRDVKPGNLFVTKRQQVKILDFGLVKVADAHGSHDSVDGLTMGADALTTVPGMTVGTIAYMSPEQARGEPLDARTDLFSFGLVLYEMATGRRAFGGTTTAIVFDAILNRAPMSALEVNPSIPAELDRIIAKAVDKDRQLRYQTALDLGTDLQRLKRDLESSSRVTASRPIATAGQDPIAASGGFRSPASASGIAAVPESGMAARGVPNGAQPSPTIGQYPAPPSGTVPATMPTTSRVSKALMLGAMFTIVVLIAIVSYLGGRIQERGAALIQSVSSAVSVPGSPPASDTAPPPAATSLTPAPERAAVVPAANASVANAVAPAAAPPAVKAVPPIDEDRAKAAQAAVAAELEDVRSKLAGNQTAQAIVALNSFLERNPANRLTPDAYMLLGQAYEATNRNDEAVQAYAALTEKFKASPRAPEALVRQAQRVLRSRQPMRAAMARQLYTLVANEYPKSDWAPRALVARAEVEERMRERLMDSTVGTYVPFSLVTYRTIAERYPSQSEDALWRMSEMLEDLNRYPLQAQALTDLTTRFPDTKHDAFWKLGEVRERRLKDTAGAIEAYSRVPTTSSKYRDAQRKVEDLKRR